MCPVRGHCQARARGIAADLPRASPKAKPSSVGCVAVVLASKTSVLLARRRPDALFGGLWEPPGAEGSLARLARTLGLDTTRLRRVGQVTHTLSHRRLVVEVVRGPLGRRVRWPLPGREYDAVEVVPLGRVRSLPQASFARKVLELAQASPQGLVSRRE
jgi:A/G-specific adenine glycosylase